MRSSTDPASSVPRPTHPSPSRLHHVSVPDSERPDPPAAFASSSSGDVAGVGPRFRPLVPAGVLDARAKGDGVLRVARRQALELMETAGAEADALRAEIRVQARAAARMEAVAEMKETMELLRDQRERLREHIVDAVLAVAEKVWGDLVVDRSAAMARIARELSSELAARAAPRVRAHPADLSALESMGLHAAADHSLEPGDFVLEADGVSYDARAEVRARLAIAELASALGAEGRVS